MAKKYPVYRIFWVDSAAPAGWTRPDYAFEVATIESVGFLIEKTPKQVTITTSVSDEGHVMNPLSIPVAAITKMKRLTSS